MEDREIINEFLVESNENLTRLDIELVELEQRPNDPALLASIFRTIHTIKGTCGFLSFSNLESVTHIAENILSQLRNGDRETTPELTSIILETMDVIRRELACIEATLKESGESYDDLRRRLTIEHVPERGRPADWTVATSGLGSAGHIASIELRNAAKAELTISPYRGTAPALIDIIGGHVQLLIDSIITLLPPAREGKIKALAISSAKRTALARLPRWHAAMP